MKKFKYLLALLLAVPVAILIAWGVSSTDASGYVMGSNKPSPSGDLTIYEIESVSEDGPLPYGRHLVLSDKKFLLKPEDGEVIFADYCRAPLVYAWQGDQQIGIKCTVDDKLATEHKATADQRIRTASAQGIKVDVQYLR